MSSSFRSVVGALRVTRRIARRLEWGRGGGKWVAVSPLSVTRVDWAERTLHGIQLWTSLPRALKLMPPRYQRIAADAIAATSHPGARVRVIGGELMQQQGPAEVLMPLVLGILQGLVANVRTSGRAARGAPPRGAGTRPSRARAPRARGTRRHGRRPHDHGAGTYRQRRRLAIRSRRNGD